MKRVALLLLGIFVVFWTFAAHADTIPDSGMDSGDCTGSIPESELSFTFTITISHGTGSVCFHNTNLNHVVWSSIAITAPATSFPPGGGEGFSCIAHGPFDLCLAPDPDLPEGQSAIWFFHGGSGVFTSQDCDPGNNGELCGTTHVLFNLNGFNDGTYTFAAQVNVPEPATIALVMPGAAILLRRRRRGHSR